MAGNGQFGMIARVMRPFDKILSSLIIVVLPICIKALAKKSSTAAFIMCICGTTHKTKNQRQRLQKATTTKDKVILRFNQ